MGGLSTPINIFSHYARIRILELLTIKDRSVTNLDQLIDLSMPEISRHLSKLADHKFVTKSSVSRKYSITEYGRLALELFSPLNYVLNNKEYFSNHPINYLPKEILFQMNKLQSSKTEFIEGTGLIMGKMKEVMDATENEIAIMVDQPFPFGKEAIAVKYIVPRNFPTPTNNPKDELKLTSVDIRIVEKLDVAMAVADNKIAIVNFSSINEGIDYSCGFYSNSMETISLLNQVWDYYWNLGEKPDIYTLRE